MKYMHTNKIYIGTANGSIRCYGLKKLSKVGCFGPTLGLESGLEMQLLDPDKVSTKLLTPISGLQIWGSTDILTATKERLFRMAYLDDKGLSYGQYQFKGILPAVPPSQQRSVEILRNGFSFAVSPKTGMILITYPSQNKVCAYTIRTDVTKVMDGTTTKFVPCLDQIGEISIPNPHCIAVAHNSGSHPDLKSKTKCDSIVAYVSDPNGKVRSFQITSRQDTSGKRVTKMSDVKEALNLEDAHGIAMIQDNQDINQSYLLVTSPRLGVIQSYPLERCGTSLSGRKISEVRCLNPLNIAYNNGFAVVVTGNTLNTLTCEDSGSSVLPDLFSVIKNNKITQGYSYTLQGNVLSIKVGLDGMLEGPIPFMHAGTDILKRGGDAADVRSVVFSIT